MGPLCRLHTPGENQRPPNLPVDLSHKPALPGTTPGMGCSHSSQPHVAEEVPSASRNHLRFSFGVFLPHSTVLGLLAVYSEAERRHCGPLCSFIIFVSPGWHSVLSGTLFFGRWSFVGELPSVCCYVWDWLLFQTSGLGRQAYTKWHNMNRMLVTFSKFFFPLSSQSFQKTRSSVSFPYILIHLLSLVLRTGVCRNLFKSSPLFLCLPPSSIDLSFQPFTLGIHSWFKTYIPVYSPMSLSSPQTNHSCMACLMAPVGIFQFRTHISVFLGRESQKFTS